PTGWRRCTSSSRCWCARSKGSRHRCASSRRSTAARCGPACSTCVRTCSAGRWTTCVPSPPDLTVVGSINLDLVARVAALPRAGETLFGTDVERVPGGKGANQAVAAAKLGANVRMVGAVGDDPLADEALAGLIAAGVELDVQRVGTTGIALIFVADDGENQ